MKKILILVLLIAAAVATSSLWLPKIGLFLAPEDNLEKADVVLLLRGDDYNRFAKTVEIFDQGYAENILLFLTPERQDVDRWYYQFRNYVYGLPEVTESEFIKRAFAHYGKDDTNVFIGEHQTTSTFEEAVASKEWMLKNGHKSLIVVSSPYHSRRAFMIFKRVYQDSGIQVYWASAQNKMFHPELWWKSEKDVKRVFEEYVSMIYNYFYHFILKKQRTSFDAF